MRNPWENDRRFRENERRNIVETTATVGEVNDSYDSDRRRETLLPRGVRAFDCRARQRRRSLCLSRTGAPQSGCWRKSFPEELAIDLTSLLLPRTTFGSPFPPPRTRERLPRNRLLRQREWSTQLSTWNGGNRFFLISCTFVTVVDPRSTTRHPPPRVLLVSRLRHSAKKKRALSGSPSGSQKFYNIPRWLPHDGW